jgi:hypothetical protein
VFVLAPALIAATLSAEGRERWARIGLCLPTFAAAVAVTNHFIWSDMPNFVRQLAMDQSHVNLQHWASYADPGWAYAVTLADDGVGWPLLVLAGAFLALRLARLDRRVWLLAAFPLLYLWFVTLKSAMFPRWVYTVLPFVVVAAAAGLAAAFEAVQRQAGLLAALTLAFVALAPALWPGAVAVSRRFAVPTYARAESWLATRAQPGDSVLADEQRLHLKGLGLKVERASVKDALEGPRSALEAYQWIVVPEGLFLQASRSDLVLAQEFAANRRFGGSRGSDFRIYAPPARAAR